MLILRTNIFKIRKLQLNIIGKTVYEKVLSYLSYPIDQSITTLVSKQVAVVVNLFLKYIYKL